MAGWEVFTAGELDEWRDLYSRIEGPSPYHGPDYLHQLAGNFEHDEERAMAFVFEEGDALVYYPFLFRPLRTLPFADEASIDLEGLGDIVSSWYYGGPLSSPGADSEIHIQFLEAFHEFCRRSGIVAEFIRFDPNAENHEDFDELDPVFNRKTVPVNLEQSAEEIWESYENRNQRAIKQAWDSDIHIEPDTDQADIAAFHEIYSNAMEAREAADHYRFSLEFFETLLGDPDLTSLLVARYRDEVIGGFIALHDERIAHHYLSASNPDYWDMRVNNLMYHEVVMHMRETGRKVFDFQGGRPGVFKFKKGFSPLRREFYIGKRIQLQTEYDQLVDDAASAGLNTDSGYFPPYRVEQSN